MWADIGIQETAAPLSFRDRITDATAVRQIS
jgi:hypothetical protein